MPPQHRLNDQAVATDRALPTPIAPSPTMHPMQRCWTTSTRTWMRTWGSVQADLCAPGDRTLGIFGWGVQPSDD
jgi:hypothetical protein